MTRWSVYLLRCCDDSLYCGITTDIPSRIKVHNSGKGAAYTRSHLPVVLTWCEKSKSRSAALKREAQIKKLSRKQKLELIQAIRYSPPHAPHRRRPIPNQTPRSRR